MKTFTEVFGWYGAGAILLAYALVSFSVLDSASLLYHVLNVTGAAGLATVSFHKKTYQPAVLNIVWAAIAVIAIVMLLL